MIKDETSFKLEDRELYPFPGSTRYSLSRLLSTMAKNKLGKIALPLPSWHFWGFAEEDPNLDFSFFNSRDAETLVEGFRKVSSRGKINCLVLTSPANPLLYEIKEEHAREIDRIALSRGIDIIIDEVLRGNRPIGQRDTIARWFSNPFIVEGFSKRFGDDPLGRFSYIVAPKGYKLDCSKPDLLPAKTVGTLLGAALKYCSADVEKELTLRNQAFDETLEQFTHAKEALSLSRPYATSLLTYIRLPKKSKKRGKDFANLAYSRGAIALCPTCIFFPENYNIPSDIPDDFRISIGRMDTERIKTGAEILCRGFEKECL